MTPQFILKAGIASYQREMLAERSTKTFQRGAWDTEEYHTRHAKSVIEELDWFPAYAGEEPKGKGILVADWNHVSRRTQNLLEQYGYELDWADQLCRCEHCGKAARTEPGYYGDLSLAWISDGGCLCMWCVVKDFPGDLVEWAMNDYTRAVIYREIDLTEFGFELKQDGFENGFHPGQNDRPKEIAKHIDTSRFDYVFRIDDAGQFDVRFSVWVREKE